MCVCGDMEIKYRTEKVTKGLEWELQVGERVNVQHFLCVCGGEGGGEGGSGRKRLEFPLSHLTSPEFCIYYDSSDDFVTDYSDTAQ